MYFGSRYWKVQSMVFELCRLSSTSQQGVCAGEKPFSHRGAVKEKQAGPRSPFRSTGPVLEDLPLGPSSLLPEARQTGNQALRWAAEKTSFSLQQQTCSKSRDLTKVLNITGSNLVCNFLFLSLSSASLPSPSTTFFINVLISFILSE